MECLGCKAGGAIVDLGAPLGDGVTVSADGGEKSDGKVTGFSILEADSFDAVQGLLEGHPHFQVPGATIEAVEFLSMPGT